MQKGYRDSSLEQFLKKVWHRSNELEKQGLKVRSEKLRKFYKRVLIRYFEKKRVNSTNYIFN